MTVSNLQIRPFETADGESVVEVVRGVFEEYGFTWDSSEYFSDIYNPFGHYVEPGGMFWVLTWDDKVIGCVGVSLHGEVAELHRMYIEKQYRGNGGGKMLLDACLQFAKDTGSTTMRIWSDVKLEAAHRLYERNGFRRVGERVCDDPDQSREYGFVRELS